MPGLLLLQSSLRFPLGGDPPDALTSDGGLGGDVIAYMATVAPTLTTDAEPGPITAMATRTGALTADST